ncbi:MAG TPA: glycosyltransferase family 9 protein [Ktedonobacterales bacterium]|nr:glycosyltransferase family 9 protein [Ktedonobacterales bacterium]
MASWLGDDASHSFSIVSNGYTRAGAVVVQDETRLDLPRRTSRRAITREPRHILVSLLSPIGDTLLATPALAALRRRYPEASLTVIVSASNAGILDGNPDVTDRILVPPEGTGPTLWRFAQAMRAINRRRNKYDLVVSLSAASSFVTFVSGLARGQYKVSPPPFWWAVGGHSAEYRARHTIDQYLLAIAPLVDPPQSDDDRAPRLFLTIQERSAARRLLRANGLAPTKLLIAMHVGGDGFHGRKRWAPKRFAVVANELIEKFDAHVLLIGGKADVPLAEETLALIPQGATLLAGATPLKVTAALIEEATLFIGNDSAPMHMAAAVGTPAVGIFGPSDWNEFHPVGKTGYQHRVVHSDLACSPCFHFLGNDAPWLPNTCNSRACLKAITPQQVMAAASDLLAQTAKPTDIEL